MIPIFRTGLLRLRASFELRGKVLALAFLLGILATLPTPYKEMSSFLWVLCLSLWGVLFGMIVCLWSFPEYLKILWVFALLFSLVMGLKAAFYLPLCLMSFWGLWYHFRQERGRVMKSKGLLLICVLGFTGTSPTLWAVSSKNIKTKKVQSRAYKLDQLVSCIVVDQIPWLARPQDKRVRHLIRDELRINSESKFYTWEVHQILDKDGGVSYVFRRLLPNGRWESWVTKDQSYNRIMDTPKGRKIVEVQRVKNMVNRPVFIFYDHKGGAITFAPGAAGQATLSIQTGSGGGRLLGPIFLNRSYCEKIEDKSLDAPPTTESQPQGVSPGPVNPTAGAATTGSSSTNSSGTAPTAGTSAGGSP